MSADHLTSETIGALVDGELLDAEQSKAQVHLRECHTCALSVLAAHKLKDAVRQATHRYVPSQEALNRLLPVARQSPRKQLQVLPFRSVAWASVAALLLIALTLGGLRQSNQQTALSADLLDQHLASLVDVASPQVISANRHTIKPWFQGKLPFSFNLPEAASLPSETVLQGADLAYLEGKPAAFLFFTIRKHRVSVFISQSDEMFGSGWPRTRAGFNIVHAQRSGLDLIGVSDASRSDVDALVSTLANAQ